MTIPLVIEAGGGEVIGDSPERRVEILSDHARLNATWSRFGPGRDGADLHVHRHHSDVFYVLRGELTVRLGIEDRAAAVPAGSVAIVPPNVVHGFRNGSDAQMSYLNFHAPGMRFADYLRAIRDGREFSYDQHDPPADGGRDPADAVVGSAEVLTDRPDVRVTKLVDIDGLSIAGAWSGVDRALNPPPGPAQWFYVLEGAFTFDGVRAEAGAWVDVPGEREISGAGRFLHIRAPG